MSKGHIPVPQGLTGAGILQQTYFELSFKEGSLVVMEMGLVYENAQSEELEGSSRVLRCYLLKCFPLGIRALINCNHLGHFGGRGEGGAFSANAARARAENLAREILFPFFVYLLKPNYSYGALNLHFHRFSHSNQIMKWE